MMIHEIFCTHCHEETEEETFLYKTVKDLMFMTTWKVRNPNCLNTTSCWGGGEKKQHYINCHN